MKKIFVRAKNFLPLTAAIMMAAGFFAVSCEEEQAGEVPATGVTITPASLSLPVEDTQQLAAIVMPDNASDKTLTWRSNKPAVIAVSADGAVTALAVGAATVTATAVNGVRGICAVAVTPITVTGVTLNQPTLSLDVDGTYTLVATVRPDNVADADKSVTWSSNATGIVTVDQSGKVTAKAVGAATITAMSDADNTKTAACVVTVNPVAVTGVSLDKTALRLSEGSTYTLTAAVAPDNAYDKSLTWSSSADGVATVDQTGKVTAVTTGSANITAMSNANSTKKATCAVAVNPVTITGVTLNPTTLELLPGKSANLAVTVAPSGAANKSVTWSSNAENVATVDQTGKVTAKAAGAAIITAMSNDDNSKMATCAVTVPAPTTINLRGTAEGTNVVLTYTDSGTETLAVTGGAIYVSNSNKTIKSLKIGGNTILIGRKADGSTISLQINGTAIALRSAGADGFIPTGSYAEFQLINTNKAGKFKMEANLDFMSETWATIDGFGGTFDGDFHTIANLTGTNGLFTNTSATIKNVGVISGNISGSGLMGAIAGTLHSGAKIIGCFNKASVTGTGNDVGGIAGWTTFSATTQIIACYNTGAIKGDTYVGGIIGYFGGAGNGANTDVIACYNTGNITSTRSDGLNYVGGIMGFEYYANANVVACYNTGEVKIQTNGNNGWGIGGRPTACYVSRPENKGAATQFGDAAWPTASTHAQWGTGDGSGDGKYWKSLGSWNGGNPVYPKLFFEQ
jgi:uncharacterized protein YjdB